MIELRDYQVQAIDEGRSFIRAGTRRIVFVAPCGAGKTVIAAGIVAGAQRRNKSILFIAHRRELVAQTSAKLDAIDCEHGIILAGNKRSNNLPVQVASVQTLIRRECPFVPDILIIDECHHARAATWAGIIAKYPQAVLIGLTATPVRTDGKGLGNLFDAMVSCPQIGSLIDRGFLVKPRCWTQSIPSLTQVGKAGGDYKLDELAEKMNKSILIGNLVRHYEKLAAGRRTIIFAVNIDHSKAICEQFRAAGHAIEHLDGTTPNDERAAILARLASGETQFVSNCAVLTEGTDIPVVSCVIIARPTMSIGLYLQMAGRALRIYPGKKDCIILDHAGCAIRHGLVDDPREWELTCDVVKAAKPKIHLADNYKVCPECEQVQPLALRVCDCGYEFSLKSTEIQHDPGDLVEASSVKPRAVNERASYEWWLYQQATRKKADGSPYSPKYAAVKFFHQFKRWPPREWSSEWMSKHMNLQRT